ncbi:MAG: SiaB family protein kinase [Bacteroidia bacterium]
MDIISKYNSVSELYKSNGKTKLVTSHCGEMSQDKANAIICLIENYLENSGVSHKAVKKIFNIVVETLQNIRLHGDKDKSGNQPSFFIAAHHEDEFMLASGNLIRTEKVAESELKLDKIKRSNEKELKKSYMEVLSEGSLSAKGGAGLGFLTIALKSENNIRFNFEKVDSVNSLFFLESKITG